MVSTLIAARTENFGIDGFGPRSSRRMLAAFRGAIHGLKMIYSRVDARKRRFIVGELKGLALLHGNRGVRVSASVALYSLGEESAG